MIVAQWEGEWCLAQHINLDVSGCSLSLPFTKIAAARAHGFNIERFYSHKYFPDTSGIRFFPKAYWRGTPVGIAGWCVHTPDARVHCEVMANDINQQAWFGRRFKSSLEWAPLARALGWGYDHNDMIATRYCTIDELELVEGPPPEGTF
jgi:hypothetical protein